MRIAKLTLQRWCQDLDPEHLDEESGGELPKIGEDAWDSLVLYSELSEEQLLQIEGQETCLVQRMHRRHHRIGGGEFDEQQRGQISNSAVPRASDVHMWAEFQCHQWACAPSTWRPILVSFVDQLKRVHTQFSLQSGWLGRNVWIVKPGANSKGSGVECMNTLPELLHHCDTMPNRVVQKYVERPLLLFSGRKFDIRQWVLVKSVMPLRIFLFSECYLRLCNEMYDLGDLRNRERHISNWQVNKNGRNVSDGAVASLQEFRDELQEITGSRSHWEDKLQPQLQEIVIQTMRAVEGKLVPRQQSFELYGFDLMIDESMRMWLLEVNLSPGCDGRTPFLDKMLSRMSERLVEVAVLGQEAPDGAEPDWVNICDDAADIKTARIIDAAQRPSHELPCCADLTVHGQQLRIPRCSRAQAVVKETRAEKVTCGSAKSGTTISTQSPCGEYDECSDFEEVSTSDDDSSYDEDFEA
jgi:hypothetical protein